MGRLIAVLAGTCLLFLVDLEAFSQTMVHVGYCVRTIASNAAPYAIAQKMGWFAESGIQIELVPIAGATDCVKFLATKQVDFVLASVEPLALIRGQGVKAHIFYTSLQGFIFRIAVPENSPVRTFADLRGKSIGVQSMGAAAVIFARGVAARAGLDPDRDVRIVVVGEGAQTAALVRKGEVDAVSQFDTGQAMLENAGIALRFLDSPETDGFPSGGLMALDETLRTQRKQAVALARGYAKGTIFLIANPEAAIRILWDVYPQAKPMGKDEAVALKDELHIIAARVPIWRLEKSGVSKWGESSEKNYSAYVDFLQKWGALKEKVPVADLVTNELIAEINNFDAAKIAAEAKAYKLH